jgi:Polysaccharide lyase family 4, domain II
LLSNLRRTTRSAPALVTSAKAQGVIHRYAKIWQKIRVVTAFEVANGGRLLGRMQARRIETSVRKAAGNVGMWLGIILAAAVSVAWAAETPNVDTAGGTIKGFIRIEGEMPKLAPLAINKDTDICKDVPNERLVVGPGKGLRYGVVTVEGLANQAAPAGAEQVATVNRLDNKGCRFVPHVLAMGVNEFLEIDNSDPILHAAHALFHEGQPQFNVGMYPGRIVHKPMVAAGIVKVICEVHPWMNAYVFVAENPYYAVTDIYGRYEIRGVPPGTYRIKAWHELLGTQEQKVIVTDGKTTEATFTFKPAGSARP